MSQTFRVGITHYFLSPDGSLALGDIGLDVLKQNERIQAEFLPDYGAELPISVANEFDGLLVLAPRISAGTLDNVILSPHAICWTDECFRGNGQAACQSIVDVASGRLPRDIVNREALERPGVQAKLARFAK